MKKIVDFPDKTAIDQQAAEWLSRLDADTPLTKNEKSELAEWMGRSNAHSRRLRQLAVGWDAMNVLTELAVPLGHSHMSGTPQARVAWSNRRIAAAAASIVVSFVVTAVYWYSPDPIAKTNGFYATAIGDQDSVTLIDQSEVLLNTNTQIKVSYSQGFRDIYLLQGEAHFTVAKNANMPFRVFAGTGRIDAIGTAFSVYIKDDIVDVAVTEGRVSLASIAVSPPPKPTNSSVAAQIALVEPLGTLEAGEVATISKEVDEHQNAVVQLNDQRLLAAKDMSKMMSWRDGVLQFSGEPLEQVVNEISRYTTLSIEISDPGVRSIPIGGRFPVGETDAMFESLEKDFGLRVTRVSNDKFVVSAGT